MLGIELPYDLAILLLKSETQTDTYTCVHGSTIHDVVIAQMQTQPKCPVIDEEINRTWCVPAM